MRHILFISLFFLACNRSEDRANPFEKIISVKEPAVLIAPGNDMIPEKTRLLRYPFIDPSDNVSLKKLTDPNRKSFICFLGKNFVSGCDVCLFNTLESIRKTALTKNVSVLYISNSSKARDMAVFKNRHQLENLYLLFDSTVHLSKYDYSCFLTPVNDINNR